jgi:lipoate-protein ligase A
MPTCRLLPYAVADGPRNMATDEVLLGSAEAGVASLRFYGWSGPTLSLGYFQPEQLRLEDPLLAPLPFVRRPSGGDTLVHHHELTYSLTLPAGPPWQSPGGSWLCRMHQVIARALARLGVSASSCAVPGAGPAEGPLCFRHFTAGDLLLGGAKVVGSAQRRHRGALLQHGAILLARSPHTPSLPGIRELTGRDLSVEAVRDAVTEEFARDGDGWELVRGPSLTDGELRTIDELVAAKYASDHWNRKR